MPQTRLIRLWVVACLLSAAVGSAGCGTSSSRARRVKPPVDGTTSSLERAGGAVGLDIAPWELWGLGLTFDGVKIGTASIKDGDVAVAAGNVAQGRVLYQAALKAPLAPAEREAVAYRIAGTYLREGKAESALATLSDYFSRERGVDPKSLDARRALFLGYVYGQAGNAEQSFAWFASAVERSPKKEIRDLALTGARHVAHSLHPDKFEGSALKWEHHGVVREAFAQERMVRAQRGYVFTARRPFQPTSLPDGGSSIVERSLSGEESPSVDAADATPRVLVLLPLSGKYGVLGGATRKGIELAFRDNGSLPGGQPMSVQFEDSPLDVSVVSEKVRLAAATPGLVAVIGPLLSELTDGVTTAAREFGVPVLSLSKRSSLQTGDGVFRLGITTGSQVSRLLEEAHLRDGLTRYALVYPETEAGYEFAEACRSELSARGLTLAYEGSFKEGNGKALSNLAASVEQAQVGGVLFPGKPSDAGVFFSSLAPEARQNIRPLGFANWSQLRDLQQSQGALSRALVVSPFYAESSREVVRSFVEAYKASYGKTPDFLSAQGFDAGLITALAVKEAFSTRSSVSSGMRAVSVLEGTTGRLSIGMNGEVIRRYAV